MKKQNLNSEQTKLFLEKFSTSKLDNLSAIKGEDNYYGGGEVDTEPDALIFDPIITDMGN
ncbi:hypothetical protein D1818_16775 [Aquimarina sp. BL5]|nr:hypothetical protein D1818_16775 [Aquimarina sp. BL5]